MPAFFDSHTHLESFVRQGQLPDLLQRARQAGLVGMVTVGTDPEDWDLYRSLAAEHRDLVHYSVGLHPCHVTGRWEEEVASIPAFFSGPDPRPVALGETGLDRFHLPKDETEAARIWGWQEASFARHIAWAEEWDCPLIVHSRGAFPECLDQLTASRVKPERVVFHCFTEGPEEMKALRDWGGRASFTGIATYKSAGHVRQAAAVQGWDQLMVETDAPYLAPVPHRGKPNQPAWVVHVVEGLAAEAGMPVGDLAAQTVAAARDFYRLAT